MDKQTQSLDIHIKNKQKRKKISKIIENEEENQV